MKKISLSTLTSILILSGSILNAADVTASNSTPKVIFTDIDSSTSTWSIWGNDNALQIRDTDAGDIIHILPSTKNDNSINIDANGTVNLVGKRVSVVRADTAVGVKNAPTIKISNPNSVTIGGSTNTLDWFLNKDLDIDDDYKNKTFNIAYDFNTSVSKIPFTIVGTANDNSVFMNENGIGILNGNPQASMDVTGDIKATFSGNAPTNSDPVLKGLMILTNLSSYNTDTTKTSDVAFGLENKRNNFKWNFRTFAPGEGFLATKEGTGGGEFRIDNPTTDFHNTKMVVAGVTVFENGHLVTASSRELKTDIKPLDPKAAMDAFHKLQPVSYEYKAQKGEPVVGFIAEDVPDLVAMPSRKSFDSAEVVAVLTSVVKQQEKQLKIQSEKIAKLEAMQQRLTRVESLLTNLALETSNKTTKKVSLNNK